ncbi:unnamed protein product [Ambrosiozyma monospora]|uniref:Unnamed protein product n=1 Tax=Ambrosiozyma monospora TaxID=43982 RepID=A0A9W7DIV3_AMBMO|nr:unnamed protein product [Ambrosiozyma monospora]
MTMLANNMSELLNVNVYQPKNMKARRNLENSIFLQLSNLLTKQQSSLQDNPQALLSTIKNLGSAFDPDAYHKYDKLNRHFKPLLKVFKKYQPDEIMFVGVQFDLAFSLIYLAWQFRKITKKFNIFAMLTTTSMNQDEISVFQRLIDLSGLSQNITLYKGQTKYQNLVQLRDYHFDWVLVNHSNESKDLEYLKILETLSLVQPGLLLSKVNEENVSKSLFNMYLLACPISKRRLLANNRSVSRSQNSEDLRATGRWNLTYKVIEKDEFGPVLFKCADFLDA